MLIAEISDAVWLALIGLVAMVVKEMLIDRPRDRRMAAKVEIVHKATNSLAAQLVETTRTEAHAAGVQEEKDRAKP